MKESYSSRVVFKSTPEQFSRLMRLDETAPEAWERGDLAAMVRHQLSATLEFDLNTLKLDARERTELAHSGGAAARSSFRTFGDLFQASHPRVDLLQFSQRFFKQKVTERAKGSPEQKVVYLFYLLSIVVARIRAGARISKLSDAALLAGIQSIMNRPWVDQQIRELLVEGHKRITRESSR